MPKINKKTYSSYLQDLKKVKEGLKEGKKSGFLCLYGSHEYLQMKTASSLKNYCSELGFSSHRLQESELNLQNFPHYWEQSSFLEPSNLYYLAEIKKYKNLSKLLASVPNQASLQSFFIFSYKADKLPVSLEKELLRLNSFLVFCPHFSFEELSQYIRELLSEYKLQFEARAIKLLIDHLGQDLYTINNELKKIALLYPYCNKPLSEKEVSVCINFLSEEHIFKLQDYILKARTAESLYLVSDLMRRGTRALALLAILARFCRTGMAIAKGLADNNTQQRLAYSLRLPPSVIKGYNSYIRLYGVDRLKNTLAMCFEADAMLKSSHSISDDLVISELIINLAEGSGHVGGFSS